jgi:hypothetical protein
MTLAMKNLGSTTANIQNSVIGGPNASDFTIVSDNCSGASLAPSDYCKISLSVQPSARGARAADLSVNANVATRGVALSADGLAIDMQWSANALDFGPIQIGGRSPRQDAYLQNSGDATLTVTSIAMNGDFTFQDIVPTINTVAPNQAKYFRLWFLPTESGTRSGSLVVHCNSPGGTYSLALTGSGVVPK